MIVLNCKLTAKQDVNNNIVICIDSLNANSVK